MSLISFDMKGVTYLDDEILRPGSINSGVCKPIK